MNTELETLIELQGYDSRIATLETEAARLPKQIEAIQASLAEAKKTVDAFKTKIDQTRKELRGKEKDLEVHAAKRAKEEARLYEVKTNKEYSAVLLEIEEVKQIKGKTEEEILGLMEMQERLAVDVKEAEGRLKTREEQAKQDEGVVRGKLAKVEQELSGRARRAELAREGAVARAPRQLRPDHEGARRHRRRCRGRRLDLRRLSHEHPAPGARWSCAWRPAS